MTDEHKCFTVSSTSYLRHLDREDINAECIAIHYQNPPKKTESGTSFGLRFPFLVVAHYVDGPQDQAERAAKILNKYWDDPEFNNEQD